MAKDEFGAVTTKLIDVRHDAVDFRTNNVRFGCYLHEDEMNDYRFVVVETFGVGNADYDSAYYATLEEAQAKYDIVKARTLSRIANAIS